MGREVGGGFMFGIARTPMVDSCQCMVKPIQYCKAKESKNKHLIKNKNLCCILKKLIKERKKKAEDSKSVGENGTFAWTCL